MDIDDLLNEINSTSTTDQNKTKKKKKVKTDTTLDKPLNTVQIVKTFEAIKLGDPIKRDEYIKNAIEENNESENGNGNGGSVVKVLDTTPIATDSIVELLDEEKKKKKKKKKKKTGEKKEEGLDDIEIEKELATDVDKNINQYNHLFLLLIFLI